jgi:hypothetical protein
MDGEAYISPSVQNPVITEDLLPSTCPDHGGRMLHITINGTGGIVQTFDNPVLVNFSCEYLWSRARLVPASPTRAKVRRNL